MPKSAVDVEDAATDITRQAELVVMDCLKSWNCPRAFHAFMEKSSVSRVSTIASERFSNDMEAKKKATSEHVSLLEHMLNTNIENKDTLSSSSRRRSVSGASTGNNGEADANVDWTKEEISALKKAIKKTSDEEDKTARWKQIVVLVGNCKSKKHCYLKYKELKQEQTNAAAKKASSRRKRSSSKSDDNSKADSGDSDVKGAIDDVPDTKNVALEEAFSSANSLSSKVSGESTVAFVASRRAATPEAKSSPVASDALEVEDCEDMEMLLEQPTKSRAQISRTGNSLGSSFASGTTRVPTASDVAAVQQLLFGTSKKTFSSHWEEQVSLML
ncbi:unnamed protein product [Phytophthora lilii]|uniref:Unnamed protein product n=1 Tax=Phytophthora lilii TaxID=2077276 RepID=A0A9W6YI24_9STRA|nr:unnamed protein product [Phytophthora lilii]